MIDLDRLRAETRGVAEVVHLNNCGSSLPPDVVVDAQVDYLRREQVTGGYETAEAMAASIDDVYGATAQMLGCRRDEVSMQPNASEAWWRAFSALDLRRGDRVLVGTSEFQANAFGLLQAAERGVVVDVVPNGSDGTIDLEAFESAFDERVRLACLTHVSMSNGAVHPAAEVGAICRRHDVRYLLDACQSAGQRPLAVDELGCDFLVYTGRKFMRGPRGTGVLYARRSTVDLLGDTPYLDGRSAEWTGERTWHHAEGASRFEWGERSYAAQVALGVATRYALDVGLDAIAARVTALGAQLRSELADVRGVTVRDQGIDRCGIVTFTVDGHEPGAVLAALRRDGVNVGAPGRRNAQWDLGRRGLDAVVRAGVHYFNSEAELATLTHAVATLDAR